MRITANFDHRHAGPPREPLITLAEFAASVGVPLAVMRGAKHAHGSPTPRLRSGIRNRAYYSRRDLINWWTARN
jgi:hypothetical protein